MTGTRRSWEWAHVVAVSGGFVIHLDSKPLRLPGGAVLSTPSFALAEAIAREWRCRAFGEEIRAEDMPLTRLAAVAQERIVPDPKPARAALLDYARSDLLCYRARRPDALVRREAELWQPWLEWAATEIGVVLRVTRGVMPVAQEPQALDALERSVGHLGVPALAALGLAVPVLGSLVLGLALAMRRISAADAADAAFAEETFQASVWGEDAEAVARRGAMRADVVLAERFMALAQG